MKQKVNLISILSMFVWLLLLVPAAGAQEQTIARSARRLLTDGESVVWAEDRSLKVLTGGTIRLLTSQLALDEYAIADGRVVFIEAAGEDKTMKVSNVRDGSQLVIAAGAVFNPTLQGNTVWWWERGDRPLLKQRNLQTMEPALTRLEWYYTFRGIPPTALLSNRHWLIWPQQSTSNGYNSLHAMSIEGGSPFLAGGGYFQPDTLTINPESNTAAAHSGMTLSLFELGSQRQEDLRAQGQSWLFDGPLALADGMLFYDRAYGEAYELWGIDLRSRSRVLIARHTEAPDERYTFDPSAAGGMLVWKEPRAGQTTLKSARIAEIRPGAANREPSPLPPNTRYFPETGQLLSGVFKRFWEQQGGLAVFGYPLSPQFEELTYDSAQTYQTQYFERQRFEHHPELAGTPYEVLLGRLGADILRQQGRDWQTFPKADSSSAHYFAETGHAIAPEFWSYWSSHGLEFGDQGISFRESLALFGFPLSEAAMETNSSGDSVLTQWFERARFEYHPNNPEPYKVLLGRLGAELL